MSTTVTIIIPIYNAYNDTEQCLKSVLKYTDSKHEILLINDASTDERIAELGTLYAQQHPNIKMLSNSENLGFVRTCNRAFSESNQQTDVILLNSDTIVTPNWIEKLIAGAYSSNYIATVTPLTNNGTICSVPTWLEYNNIPEGHDIISFANLIEKISLRKYPCIPTAVGFCMYIKREVLNKVGYFDAVNFYRGYGEENDFCCRAIKNGYFHIIDDATFIYHAGSKSFKAEKQKLIEENSKILSKLHPRYFTEVNSLIQANPFKDILDNIRLHLQIEHFKKLSPICFILHNAIDTPVNNPLGGTEYHCAALTSNIAKQRPVYVLYVDESRKLIEFDIFYKKQKINFKFPYKAQYYGQRYFTHESDLLRILSGIFQYFQPSLIHIHHLIGLPITDATTAIKQLNIPYIISLHDYYFICPSQNLIDYKEKFCFEHKNPEYCQTCIQSLFNEGEELKQQWSILCQELLNGATTIIAPSQTALSYFLREYPQLQQKSKVINHGIYTELEITSIKKNTNYSTVQEPNQSSHTFCAALVGSINIAKGSKVFIDLLDNVWQKPNLAKSLYFEIIGRFNLILPSHIKNVKIHSEYSRKDLGERLKGVDVAIFPNIWAETYCLTVDEVLAHGIPVIVTDISAASERVKEFEVGWICKPNASDFVEILVKIKNNPVELAKVRQNIKNYSLRSYEEMTNNYIEEYEKIPNTTIRYDQNSAITPREITQSHCFTSYHSITITQNEQFELRKLDLMIRAMESSKWWKLRVALLRLKQKLGIAIDDLWMRERGSNFK